MAEPYELLITEAVAAIRAGSLSPLELVDSLLARIEQTESRVRAWVHVDAEGARAQARMLETSRDFGGWLAGVPMGFKDLYDVRGLPTAAGFAPWARRIATDDATVVGNLRSHGMIALGKTVTTQFAFSDPPLTRNPWDLQRTASGSSSGSGASVAARQTTAALGTQTTGSNLRPAAYNGIVGFKPSHGLLSRRGIVPLAWSMDHPGILARSVEDAALILDSMLAPRVQNPAPAPGRNQHVVRSPRPPRIGLLRDFQAVALPVIRDRVEYAARQFAAAGAQVHELTLPTDLEVIKATQWTLLQCEAAELHRNLFAQQKDHYGPRMRAMVEVAQTLPAWAYLRSQRLRARIRREVDALFDRVDCLLSPVSPDLPPLISAGTTGDYSLLAPWSLLGLPAASVPAGLTNEGLPLAIQLAARQGADATALSAARWCEQLLGRIGSPPL